MAGQLKLACIFMAAGRSKRFGGNKLLSPIGGQPMADLILKRHPAEYFQRTVVVTRYAPVAVTAAALGFAIVENNSASDDIAITIRLGLAALDSDTDGCMFSVCDQPGLTTRSVVKLVAAFRADPSRIAALGCGGERGNPVLFPRALFGELKTLSAGQSGSAVILAHPELLTIVEADNPSELEDLDYPSKSTADT